MSVSTTVTTFSFKTLSARTREHDAIASTSASTGNLPDLVGSTSSSSTSSLPTLASSGVLPPLAVAGLPASAAAVAVVVSSIALVSPAPSPAPSFEAVSHEATPRLRLGDDEGGDHANCNNSASSSSRSRGGGGGGGSGGQGKGRGEGEAKAGSSGGETPSMATSPTRGRAVKGGKEKPRPGDKQKRMDRNKHVHGGSQRQLSPRVKEAVSSMHDSGSNSDGGKSSAQDRMTVSSTVDTRAQDDEAEGDLPDRKARRRTLMGFLRSEDVNSAFEDEAQKDAETPRQPREVAPQRHSVSERDVRRRLFGGSWGFRKKNAGSQLIAKSAESALAPVMLPSLLRSEVADTDANQYDDHRGCASCDRRPTRRPASSPSRTAPRATQRRRHLANCILVKFSQTFKH